MANLTVSERERRQREYANRWVPGREFNVRAHATCGACGEPMPVGTSATFRRWQGLGSHGQLVHAPDCVDR